MNNDIISKYEKHKKLIYHVIEKHYPQLLRSNYYEDAIQEGSISLLKAIKMFNKNRGYKFSTYAYTAIKNGIYRFFYKTDSHLKISHHFHGKYLKYKELKNKKYSNEQIKEQLKITQKELLSIINTFNKDYLERKVSDKVEDGATLLDIIPCNTDIEENTIEKIFTDKAVILCKSFLVKEDLLSISLFLNGVTQREISLKLNMSRSNVSRRINRIKEKVFPVFKEYILNKIYYGQLCLKLLNYNNCVKNNIKTYMNYAFYCNNLKHNKKFEDEISEIYTYLNDKELQKINIFLNSRKRLNSKIEKNLSLILNVIDKYYSKENIPYILYNRRFNNVLLSS